MPSTGTWFVMCDAKKAVDLPKLAKKLGPIRNVKITVVKKQLHLEIHDKLMKLDVSADVGLSTEKHVIIEAREIAERKNRPEVAKLDARYELLFELKESDSVWDPLLIVAAKLEKATKGVIYDANNGRFF